MQGGGSGQRQKSQSSADSCLAPSLLPNLKRLPNGPEPALGHLPTPPLPFAKSQSNPGIDQSPGARPGPLKRSWELSQKPDPRGNGRTEAHYGGRGMFQ